MIVPADKEVRILTRNFLNADCTVTSSHGGTTSYLYDFDKYSKFTTSGAKRDTIAVTLTITLKVGATETTCDINTIALLNTNVRAFKAEWYRASDASYQTIFDFTAEENSVYISFGTIQTSRIRLTLYSTQQPNSEKSIGSLIIARQRFYLSKNPITYEMMYRDKRRALELGDGQHHIAFTRFSNNRIMKYGARLAFEFLNQQDIDNLEALKNEGQPFLFYPEASARPDEIYLVNWVNQFLARYTINYKGAGFSVDMELEEV